MSFLTAEWRKLVFVNYKVDPALLQPYVPHGTVLDLWQGNCYLSLIGFLFTETRLRGLKIPFHVSFEEVNLRFYVKRETDQETRRGVVFIKEIVPKPAIALVANLLYQESYQTLRMRHSWDQQQEDLLVKYEWKKRGEWQHMAVKASNSPQLLEPGSETEFITEHYWGYAATGKNKTTEYEVTHPRWKTYLVRDLDLMVDFGLTYGPKFHFLSGETPSSIMLAEGSPITIEGKSIIRK